MQNKTKTYLLIIAVLGVWGTIAYQFINGVASDDVPEVNDDVNSKFKPKPIVAKDTFSIQPVKRDPFLGTLTKVHNTPIKVKSSGVKKIVKFPLVTYNARIKKAETKSSLYIVTINNQQYKLKRGQVMDSVTLVSGNANAVTLRYKNQTKIIKRQ